MKMTTEFLKERTTTKSQSAPGRDAA
jgi:hypothetical protein